MPILNLQSITTLLGMELPDSVPWKKGDGVQSAFRVNAFEKCFSMVQLSAEDDGDPNREVHFNMIEIQQGEIPTLKLFNSINGVSGLQSLPHEQRRLMNIVSSIFPFRVNNYVVENLINWDRIPDDPIFRLLFPQPEMLAPKHLAELLELIDRKVNDATLSLAASRIRRAYNPHPDGQFELNVPMVNQRPFVGMQHKYAQTLLFFPSHSQTCHSYCGYCFRWAQFIHNPDLHFASTEATALKQYVVEHPDINSILITGGDPLIMRADVLARYLDPLLSPPFEGLEIRIGTKSIAFWPHRFLTDHDAEDLLRLFERVVRSGHHLAIMFHNSHPREISTSAAQLAIKRIRETGAIIRSQAPVVRYVNDDPGIWAAMWKQQVQLGIVPYYMFITRDTGPQSYYQVPLVRAHQIYREAQLQVSGLARTARGPSMSTEPGKITIDGILEISGERFFALRFLQGRNQDWTGRPFLARFDDQANWLSDLHPPGPGTNTEFFFEQEMRVFKQERHERLQEFI